MLWEGVRSKFSYFGYEYLTQLLLSSPFRVGAKMSFQDLSKSLKMGKKYLIESLHEHAIQCLSEEFPSTWEAFSKTSSSYIHLDSKTFHDFDLLSLINEHGPRVIFASNALVCLSYSTQEILLGCRRKQDDSLSELPQDLQRTMLLARERLSTSLKKHLTPFITKKCEDSACLAARYDHLLNWWLQSPFIALNSTQQEWSKNACGACTRRISNELSDVCTKIWDEVPGLFELSAWEKLREELDNSSLPNS
jgi:hypothetical protein